MIGIKMIRIRAVLAKVGLGRTALYDRVRCGEFPRPVSLGGRAVAWVEAEVEAYLAGRIAARAEAR
jgi:prophage regulatory protein